MWTIEISVLLILNAVCLLVIGNRIIDVIKERNKIDKEEQKNKRDSLFMQVSAEYAQNEIDKYIDGYINRYYANTMNYDNYEYIRSDMQREMLNEITKSIIKEIPQLYLFYISLLINIESEEELAKFVYKNTKARLILFISEHNTINV